MFLRQTRRFARRFSSVTGPGATGPDDPVKWTFGRFVRYGIAGSSLIWVSYHIYLAGGNMHTAEILMTEKLKRLPFHPPPDDSLTPAQRNSANPVVSASVSQSLLEEFTNWFIEKDAKTTTGVTRQDVIDKLCKLGTPLDELAEKEFLHRGRGRVDEQRRLSGVGLAGAVTALEAACKATKRTESVSNLQTKVETEPEHSVETAVLDKLIAEMQEKIDNGKTLTEAEQVRFDDLLSKRNAQ